MRAQRNMSARRLASYLLLWNGYKVAARPNPQEQPPPTSESIVPITLTGEADGQPVTAVYTPTSFSLEGLTPPITSATTVTTTDEAGATIAIAIAAGAGVVGGGALAAWLFEPVPGAPPAPTEPPSYSTEEQPENPPSTENPDEPEPTSTTTEVPACPFPTEGSGIAFEQAPDQPEWTVEIPSQTTSGFSSECTPSRGDHLFQGSFPEFIEELSVVFCQNDLSDDLSKELGKDDLPDDSSWKRDNGPQEKIAFTFTYKADFDDCAEQCEISFAKLISNCKYNSHYLYGGGSLERGCGTYALKVGGSQHLTELNCAGEGDDPLRNYMYRDVAKEAIENFCEAQDGHVLEKDNDDTFISEDAFSLSYGEHCGGDGSYTVKKDTCIEYLTRTLDECDTDTEVYKHGGTIEDMDDCGLFEFHPTYWDLLMCYPENEEKGYILPGDHAVVTKEMAEDAINSFCDREGGDEQYTLDPDVPPNHGDFIENTCEQEGWASCGYFYTSDGERVGKGEGDVLIRIEAMHFNPNDAFDCPADQVYEIQGDRCRNMLAKAIGEGPGGDCVNDDGGLDLGTFIEVGDKGCVTWNAWAINI